MPATAAKLAPPPSAQVSGIVFDIQRGALLDGPGIRTTVFLKGCPLRCVWCHNPESQDYEPELWFDAARCAGSTECIEACSQQALSRENGHVVLDRSRCNVCGDCVAACSHRAFKVIGERMSVEQVMAVVLKDVAFYGESGGGLTLSGGEPLAQFEFALALLKSARKHGIHTCLDTCGAASAQHIAEVLPYVDVFLYDYKATDPREHRHLTGVSNKLILENLDYLYHSGARIILRCPLIPGINDSAEHLRGITSLSAGYPLLTRVEIMPYHRMGEDKATKIGKKPALTGVPDASDEAKENWRKALHLLGCTRVIVNCGG